MKNMLKIKKAKKRSHLEILNLITPEKIPFPNKVSFSGFRG